MQQFRPNDENVSPGAPIEYSNEYAKFWELWREEKFFECHEVLEELWKRTKGRERWFYNGLIHGAVAIYQHRRGNGYGACRQLLRAQVKLLPFAPHFWGVDVFALLQSLETELASSLIQAQMQMTKARRAENDALRDTIQKRMARDFPNPDAPEDLGER